MFLDDSQEVVNPLNIIILGVLASVAVHLLLRRNRVRKEVLKLQVVGR